MKHSDIKAPKGATHVKLVQTDGKNATVPIKDIETLDGSEGSLTFLKKSGKEFLTLPLDPHGAATTVVMAFLEQKGGRVAIVRAMNDNAKEVGRALKALGQKFHGGTWGRDLTAEVASYKGDVDVDLTLNEKAKASLTVEAAAKSRPAKGQKPPAKAPKTPAAPVTAREGRMKKWLFIEQLLTTSGFKLSTILDKTQKEYPEGDARRTLKRIRDDVVTLKKARKTLNFIDEPDYKVGK